MPTYTYTCDSCGAEREDIRRVADRHDPTDCECGASMRFRIIPPQIAPILGGGDLPGYKCPVTDEFVTSKKRRRQIMKEHDLVETG